MDLVVVEVMQQGHGHDEVEAVADLGVVARARQDECSPAAVAPPRAGKIGGIHVRPDVHDSWREVVEQRRRPAPGVEQLRVGMRLQELVDEAPARRGAAERAHDPVVDRRTLQDAVQPARAVALAHGRIMVANYFPSR